jgi:hypothetical protein
MTPTKIFTCDGYDFYRCSAGYWNVSHRGNAPPTHCAYASPEPIAKQKSVNLRNISWELPVQMS